MAGWGVGDWEDKLGEAAQRGRCGSFLVWGRPRRRQRRIDAGCAGERKAYHRKTVELRELL